jgi:integrase
MLTTHTMRRTGITTLLRMGVPDYFVRKISGHTANSAEFFRYVQLAQNYLHQHTDAAFEKLKNIN